MSAQATISATKLRQRVGQRMTVLVDEITDEGLVARSYADAPEIDGVVLIKETAGRKPGELMEVIIFAADEADCLHRINILCGRISYSLIRYLSISVAQF